MNRATLAGICISSICLLAACGTVSSVTPAAKTQANPAAITFFHDLSTQKSKVVLHPDASVKQAMPNIKPTKQRVIAYLPVYPGSNSIPWVSGIGDAGTPMNGDLVDGTVFFESKDSAEKVQAWYADEFKKLGYTMGSQGSYGDNGKTTSTYVEFTNQYVAGTPARDPDISLGFLSQRLGGETIFKLQVSYIAPPARPNDSYLPTNIVKVVLTKGRISKTITDKTWIHKTVHMLNSLQAVTPGMSAGAAVTGVPATIHADFYENDNSVIQVIYSVQSATIIVGHSKVALNAGSVPELGSDLGAPFRNSNQGKSA